MKHKTRQKEKERGTKELQDKYKTMNKIAKISPSLSVIASHVNGIDSPNFGINQNAQSN